MTSIGYGQTGTQDISITPLAAWQQECKARLCVSRVTKFAPGITWGTFELFVGCAQAVRCAKAKAQKPVQVAVLAYELISQAFSPEHS